ncbi:MAG: hypothetical protein ACLSGV_00470 [Eubacterium sp.]
MTKIYNAKTFLEADQIIATLQSQHISAEKREISDMNVITGKWKLPLRFMYPKKMQKMQ